MQLPQYRQMANSVNMGWGGTHVPVVPTKNKKPPWSFQGGLASVAVGQALIAFALHPLAHQLADAAG